VDCQANAVNGQDKRKRGAKDATSRCVHCFLPLLSQMEADMKIGVRGARGHLAEPCSGLLQRAGGHEVSSYHAHPPETVSRIGSRTIGD